MKNFQKTLSFDDVLLVPQMSEVKTRKEIDLTSKMVHREFAFPVISSPMDTVTGPEMASSMARRRGIGILHRYNTIDEQVAMAGEVDPDHRAAAIGVTGDYLERAKELVNAGCFMLCIDVAHGHHINVKSALQSLRSNVSKDVIIMAGNVATAEGFQDLEDWGANAIRVGVGGGSICSTRIQTGHGVPTFHSVLSVARVAKTASIIADGGIKTPGDAVKCFAAGADFVMLGSLLAGTEESPGQVFSSNEGKKYKVYRGMASSEAQIAWKGTANSLEGISTTIPYKGSVNNVLSLLDQNIRSGLSYSGARNLKEFRGRVKMIEQTSAGMKESSTHILKR
jgi:IMP dehydrogenase